MKRIYIAGPYSHPSLAVRNMRVVRHIHAAQQVAARGHMPLSPVAMFYILDENFGATVEPGWGSIMDACIKILAVCDAVLLLPGWRLSKGARHEHKQAVLMGLDVYYDWSELP